MLPSISDYKTISQQLRLAVRAAEIQLDRRSKSTTSRVYLNVSDLVHHFGEPADCLRLRFGYGSSVPHQCFNLELFDTSGNFRDEISILHEHIMVHVQLALAGRIPEFIERVKQVESRLAVDAKWIISEVEAATESLIELPLAE